MLEQVKIKNINSINSCTIDFIKGDYDFGEENVSDDIVNPIAIYGHNGSGKSSFLNAMKQFIVLMTYPIDQVVPFIVNNINFDKYVKSDVKDDSLITGSIELTFKINEISYRYYLEVSRVLNVKKEYLLRNNENYFNRSGDKYTFKNKDNLIDKNDSTIIPLIRKLANEDKPDPIIKSVYTYLSSFVHVDLQLINEGGFVTSNLFGNTKTLDLLVQKSDDVQNKLKENKEFPIYSVKKLDTLTENSSAVNQYLVEIEGDDNFRVNLPFAMISTGMRNTSILLSIILSLPNNGVIFVDELEIALHPSIIKDLIKIVQKLKIQLVFSSHNTNILEYLRPDQVYFARWKKGFSTLMRLSEIYPNIREVNNIEKMYLNSVFDERIDNYVK